MRATRWSLIAAALLLAGPATAASAAVAAGSRGAGTAADAGLGWAQAFPVAHREAAVHFIARYRDAAGADHRLEVWRVGERYLHRRSDDQLDLYVVPAEGAGRASPAELAYRLVDHRRRAVFDVARTNLHRIGVFSSWDAQAHVLERPATRYRLSRVTAPAGIAGADCAWRRIDFDGKAAASTVCWSARWGLPLVIAGGEPMSEQFRVLRVETIAPAAAAALAGLPEIPAGYGYFDSNEEIGPE